jgi:hypothetical protein
LVPEADDDPAAAVAVPPPLPASAPLAADRISVEVPLESLVPENIARAESLPRRDAFEIEPEGDRSTPSSSMPSPIAIAAPEHNPLTTDAATSLHRLGRRARIGIPAATLLAAVVLWGTLHARSMSRSDGPTGTAHAATRVDPTVTLHAAAVPSVRVTSIEPASSAHPSGETLEPAPPSASKEPPTPNPSATAPREAPKVPSIEAPGNAPSEARAAKDPPQPQKLSPTQPIERSHPTAAASKADRAAETELPDPNQAPARSGKSNVDEDALQQALAQAAQRAQGCHVPGGPTGSVRVSITFAPSGDVTGATVQGASFSNTIEGECIAAKFRALHIPAFSGSDFVARKTVAIE